MRTHLFSFLDVSMDWRATRRFLSCAASLPHFPSLCLQLQRTGGHAVGTPSICREMLPNGLYNRRYLDLTAAQADHQRAEAAAVRRLACCCWTSCDMTPTPGNCSTQVQHRVPEATAWAGGPHCTKSSRSGKNSEVQQDFLNKSNGSERKFEPHSKHRRHTCTSALHTFKFMYIIISRL